MSSQPAFEASLFLADKLVRRGEHADAVTVMHPWVFSDLPDWNKTIVAYNLAQVHSHLGQVEQVLAWFDYGIALEQPLQRTLVAEGKATWLFEQGRREEAAAIWMGLLAGPLLDDAGRDRVQRNLATALGTR